jgi:UDP-N-acetylglucosamine 3-dehydrogenase
MDVDDMKPAKIGVVGLGNFGAVHSRIWAQLPQAELVAVCSRSAERAQEVAATYGAQKWYTDYRQMMADPVVDAVDVCTEVARHGEVALAALQHGKHVFSEILLSMSLAETDQLLEWANKSRAIFMVGFIERFDVRRALIKRKIDDGEIGALVSLFSRRNQWRGWLEYPNPDPRILQPGIHTIDLLLWLAREEVRQVYTRTRNMVDQNNPDVWWTMLTFESGLIGVIEKSYFMPDRKLFWADYHVEVVGTKETVHITEPNDATWVWTPAGTLNPELYFTSELHGKMVGALADELAYFADCVVQGRSPTLGTLQEARAALRVGLAVVESAKTGEVVQL